jgi:transposase
VLLVAEGRTIRQVAAELSCNRNTVSKWRRRFAERRLDGVIDEPRPGRPRSITDAQVERVIVKTLEERPAGATHWSTRSLAQATGMSQTAVCRIWQAFGLKPHLTETFKLSADPQFIDKASWAGGIAAANRYGFRGLFLKTKVGRMPILEPNSGTCVAPANPRCGTSVHQGQGRSSQGQHEWVDTRRPHT